MEDDLMIIHLRTGDERTDRPVPGGNSFARDAELVRAARRGDKRAFVEIVARHQAMVCGVALGILGDVAASEDAAQEAFLTAWRKLHDLREPERLRAWLGQIARHAALGHLRRKRGEDALEDVLGVVDESPTPDEAAAKEEEAKLVREFLAKLPESYRVPLILFYREGQSVRHVAEALGITEDAVKQRLARGREMLHDRMSGLIETVLKRNGPTPIFTMTIAAAIGALAAPAAVAGGVFTAASVSTGASTAAASATPILTAMSISKTTLLTAVFVTAVCIPVGYHLTTGRQPSPRSDLAARAENDGGTLPQRSPPPNENSLLLAEWRQLHDIHGRTAEAMPVLYKVIAEIKDPFRRRAFRTALLAEWVQLEPARGLAFILGKGPDAAQRRQFFEEWLALDARAAVDALLKSGPGWEGVARDCLPEIARRVPARVADIVARLPKPDSYWDRKVRDAFAIIAEGGLAATRSAAEAMTGPNREQALAGVAQVWAKSDLPGAIAWAKALPEGTDRDEIIRAALLGRASVDPAAALELVGLVPSGGRTLYFATTTGARVLTEAAKADFDATMAWIAAHPGRLRPENMDGLATAVTERLNADAVGFLANRAADGSLVAIMPAINSAMLNEAAGQRAAIWDWVQGQPDTEAIKALKKEVLRTAGYQDPDLALRLVADVPRTPDGDAQVEALAQCLLNSGQGFRRFANLLAQAPERLRQPLVTAGFNCLRADTLEEPSLWITRLSQLPTDSRAWGAETIARAWAGRAPEEAIGWATSLAPGQMRNGTMAAIASTWAEKDAYGAAEWVGSLSAGAERDRCAQSLALALAERFPREAWDWAVSIDNADQRRMAATDVARAMAARDPATARQWIEAGPFTPEVKAELQAALARPTQSPGPR